MRNGSARSESPKQRVRAARRRVRSLLPLRDAVTLTIETPKRLGLNDLIRLRLRNRGRTGTFDAMVVAVDGDELGRYATSKSLAWRHHPAGAVELTSGQSELVHLVLFQPDRRAFTLLNAGRNGRTISVAERPRDITVRITRRSKVVLERRIRLSCEQREGDLLPVVTFGTNESAMHADPTAPPQVDSPLRRVDESPNRNPTPTESDRRGQAALVEALRDLGPWHFDIEIARGVRTVDGNRDDNGNNLFGFIPLIKPEEVSGLLRRVYPQGLEGKSFLDVACNAGGYSFVAKAMGASRTLGFDVRAHWIAQAEFVKRHWSGDSSGMRFREADLHSLDLDEHFDITMFKGILYHLPDPVAALKRVADLTREIMILDTETEGERGELCLRLCDETTTNLMSGVHGLAWFPSGPDVVERIARWAGFEEVRELFWEKKPARGARANPGRCRLVAARSATLLRHFDDVSR